MEQDAHAPKAQTLIISTHANDGQSPAVVPFTEDDASCANGAQVNKYLKRKRRVATYTSYTKVEKLKDKVWGMDEGWGYFSDAGNSESSGGVSKKKINRRTYEWNAENQLTGTTDESLTVNYTYGADGKRASKYTHSSETLYFNDYWVWHIDSATRSRGGKVTKNIYLGTERLASRIGSYNTYHGEEKESTFFYHSDHLGSAQLVTDCDGNEYQRLEYTPYGETWMDLKAETSLITKLPYRFSAKELDEETGFYYYGARYLDPKMSRWISADPAMNTGEYFPVAPTSEDARRYNGNLPGMGGIFNHINFHLYHYANNNPVRYTDPDGRDVNPSNMGLRPEIRKQMNSLENLMAVAKYIKQSGISNGIDLKLFYTSDYCWARATIIRKQLEEMGYDVDGYTFVISPLNYEAKQAVKNGTLDPSTIDKDDPRRFAYHVGVTVKIDGEFYVVDPFYSEYSIGLSKQEDWIKVQYGMDNRYQTKDEITAHLIGVDIWINIDTGMSVPIDFVTSYNEAKKSLDGI